MGNYFPGFGHSLFPVRGRIDLITLPDQVVTDELKNVRFVVDQQNPLLNNIKKGLSLNEKYVK